MPRFHVFHNLSVFSPFAQRKGNVKKAPARVCKSGPPFFHDAPGALFRLIRQVALILAFLCLPLPGRADDAVVLQLKWYPQFQFAGYYAALEKGFYKNAGLDVELRPYDKGIEPVQEVLSGRADFGVGTSEVLLQRLAGKPVRVGAVIFQHSPSVLLILLESGIQSLHDLAGRRVMISQEFDLDIWAMLINEGLAKDQIEPARPLTWDIEELISGKVEAFVAYATNTPFLLIEKGLPYITLTPRTYGVDFYGDCLFSSENYIRQHPEIARRFIRASLEGWGYALDHTEEMADLILSKYHSSKSRDHLLFEAGVMRDLILPELVQLGHMNPGRWEFMAETCVRLGMAEPGFDLTGFIFDPNAAPEPGWINRNFWVIAWILASALLITAWLAFFNRRLRAKVRERTLELVRLNRDLTREVEERVKAEKALQRHQDHLEELVRERTAKLSETHLALSREKKDKKEVQKAYVLSERRMRQIIHNIQAAVVLLAPDSTVLSMNPMAQSLLGASEAEFLGKTTEISPWRMVNEEGGKLLPEQYPVRRVLDSKKALSGLAMGIVRNNNSHPVWITVGANPLFDAAGQVDRIVVTFMDISKRKKAEEALMAAKLEAEAASAAKSNFLTSMSHELRTPLNAVIGFAEVLKDPYYGTLNPKQQEFVSDIHQSGRNLLRMIDEILDITDILANPPENNRVPVYLSSLIQNCIASQKKHMDRFHQQLEVRVSEELEKQPLDIDQEKTLHILEHLLANAVKFTPEHGKIRVAAKRQGPSVVIQVADTGIGIEKEKLQKLFQDFFQASSGLRDKTPGAGLGLSISRRLVQAMGGKIWVQSEGKGKGSVFCFSIPLN